MLPTKETLSIEFKSDQKTIGISEIVDEVVGLSNTEGGDLYIGIEDDGTPTGAQQQHRDAVQMMATVAQRTVPPVSVRAQLEQGEVPVMHLEIPRSTVIVATSSGKILRRRLKADGTPECIPMYPHEIATRLSDLGRLDYSAQPIPDSTRDDFDPMERERLRQMVRQNSRSDRTLLDLSDEEMEKALGLTVRVGDQDIPTLTGLLMIGKQEAIEKLVPTSEAAFQVLTGTDIKMNATYRQTLLYTIDKIYDSIEPWNPETEVQFGLFSEPVPVFNRRAVREALVNAFGHRDYSVLGRVRVQIDDGGLTIVNPGGFIEGINAKNLITAEPRGRNPRLMDALKRVGVAERTGRGIDRIYEGSLLYGRPLPDYSASNSVNVSLYIARSEPDLDFVKMLSDERDRMGASLSLQSLLVLDALKRNRRCALRDLVDQVDAPEIRLRQTLEELTEAGLVEAAGSGQGRAYHLSSAVYKRSGKNKEYVRQADIDKVRWPEMILRLANQQGRVTRADVADLLHITKDAAYYQIDKLVEQGQLKLIKAGPNSHYIPI